MCPIIPAQPQVLATCNQQIQINRNNFLGHKQDFWEAITSEKRSGGFGFGLQVGPGTWAAGHGGTFSSHSPFGQGDIIVLQWCILYPFSTSYCHPSGQMASGCPCDTNLIIPHKQITASDHSPLLGAIWDCPFFCGVFVWLTSIVYYPHHPIEFLKSLNWLWWRIMKHAEDMHFYWPWYQHYCMIVFIWWCQHSEVNRLSSPIPALPKITCNLCLSQQLQCSEMNLLAALVQDYQSWLKKSRDLSFGSGVCWIGIRLWVAICLRLYWSWLGTIWGHSPFGQEYLIYYQQCNSLSVCNKLLSPHSGQTTSVWSLQHQLDIQQFHHLKNMPLILAYVEANEEHDTFVGVYVCLK